MNNNTCPVCKSNTTKEHPVPKGKFFKCSSCGILFLDRRSVASDQEQYYSEDYYAEDYSARKDHHVFNYRLPIVNTYVPLPAKVLEVGAASGDFLSVLKKQGYEVEGLELSKRASEVGENHYGISIKQGDLSEEHFAPDTFDAVMMYHVFEHVPDPKADLAEMHRILKKGGKLIIEVPNPASVDARLSKNAKKSIYDFPNHMYLYTPAVLGKLAKEAGFEIELMEISLSYWLTSRIQKLRSFLKSKETKQLSPASLPGNSTDKKIPLKKYHDPIVKKILRKVLPGMKITLVAKKI